NSNFYTICGTRQRFQSDYVVELYGRALGSDLQCFTFHVDFGRYTYGNGHGHFNDDGAKHDITAELASKLASAVTVVRMGIAAGVRGHACSVTRILGAKEF
ncbi:MAG TPA: hypothetical protein VGR55_07325, partial [Candidatus Acidoferrum sp.]|nr:hypothetical protein [Candidatus Acidoferrum sp.]